MSVLLLWSKVQLPLLSDRTHRLVEPDSPMAGRVVPTNLSIKEVDYFLNPLSDGFQSFRGFYLAAAWSVTKLGREESLSGKFLNGKGRYRDLRGNPVCRRDWNNQMDVCVELERDYPLMALALSEGFRLLAEREIRCRF